MKTLIVEDDPTSRALMNALMKRYGTTHLAADGREGVAVFQAELDGGEPFELVCMDIMMPEMDGHTALKEIRKLEDARGISPTTRVKVVMTTALGDLKSVSSAYQGLCDAYLVKPITKPKLLAALREMGLAADENAA